MITATNNAVLEDFMQMTADPLNTLNFAYKNKGHPRKKPLKTQKIVPGKTPFYEKPDIRPINTNTKETKEDMGVILNMSREQLEEMLKAKEKEEAVKNLHHNSIWYQKSTHAFCTRVKEGDKKKVLKAQSYDKLIDRLFEFYGISGQNSFESMFFAMINEKSENGTTTKTTAEYRRLFDKYYKGHKIIDKDINKIDFLEWKQFYTNVLKKYNMTQKQFRQVLIVANQTINYCIATGVMSLNPIRDIMKADLKFKTAPAYNQIKAKALTEEQAEKIKEWADEELQNVKKAAIYPYAMKFNLTAGTRYGELTGIKWTDINFEEGSIIIQRQLVLSCEVKEDGKLSYSGKEEKDTLKSGEEIRKIPITEEMEEILQCVKALKLDGEYVFPMRYHTYNDKVKEAAKYAGIQDMHQIRTHSIRTTAATTLYRKCKNVRTVQALLGHTTPEMTNKYVKNLNCFEDLKAAML